MSCKHEFRELIEIEGDIVWARCPDCFVLFKYSKKEWNETMVEVSGIKEEKEASS